MSGGKQNLDPLSKTIRNFQKLNEVHEKETTYMKKLYKSIKGQCLEIVYLSPKIKDLVTEEELSGFILYLEERLKPLILNFDPKRTSFEYYLIKMVSFRALNYLAKKIKEERLDFALSRHVYIEEQARIAEKEWTLFMDEQKCPNKERITNILRYICHKRPSFQKRIFIYLLSILPYIAFETIEKICDAFNIDIEQTLVISNMIFEKMSQCSTSRDRYLDMRNRNWSQLLLTQFELEQVCESFERGKLQKKEHFYSCRNEQVNIKLDTLRKKLNYQHISKTLKIPPGTISSTVYLVKNVLIAIETGAVGKVDKRGLVALIQEANEVSSLPDFRPFDVFDIDEFDRLQEE